ncbi:MAG TPA: ABC transporter permease [Candidatus Didemnitutus sp.]|nr:ABC transporter permease [Candidatus Didemnitutus sp.]
MSDPVHRGTRAWRSALGLVGALVVMIGFFGVCSHHFLSAATFTTIANQIPDLLVMSVGMTFVLLIGGIDLSVGSILAFAGSVIGVAALRWGWSPWAAAAAGLLASGAAGALTGLVCVLWRAPSFIVSLGMLEIARGLAYRLTDSRTAYIGDTFDWMGNPWALGIAPAFVVAVAIAALGQWILSRTVFGRHATAIGTNEEAVRLVGVDSRPYKVAIFAASGALAGLAALFQISRLEAADPNAGVGMELQVIAAAVIGGTSLMGGRASIVNTVLGALVIAVLEAGLAQVGASEPTKRIITGAVIVGAVVLDRYRVRRV